MNRTILLAGVATLALTLAACSREADAGKSSQGLPDANPMGTLVTPADEDRASVFVNMAAASDMFEIESSKVALQRSQNAQVKAFAQTMIDMHGQTTTALKAAITESGLAITPPKALPQDKADRVAALRSAEAADFDKAYLDAQIEGHQQALDLFTRYADNGDDRVLQAAAMKVAPIIQGHLDQARSLREGLS